MWHRATDVEEQLQEYSELLFENPVPIPKCWWHRTKTKTQYTLESYWCHETQTTKPNILVLSEKTFEPKEHSLIYILCTIASWKAIGQRKRREYRNELLMQKNREYFGETPKNTPLLSDSAPIDAERIIRSLSQKYKRGCAQFPVPMFISGTVSSGKTNMMYIPPNREDS